MPTPKRSRQKPNGNSATPVLNDARTKALGGFDDPLIMPDHIAHLLGVSKRTEASMYADGDGPPCIKIRHRRYSTKATVEAWAAARLADATREALKNFGGGIRRRSGQFAKRPRTKRKPNRRRAA